MLWMCTNVMKANADVSQLFYSSYVSVLTFFACFEHIAQISLGVPFPIWSQYIVIKFNNSISSFVAKGANPKKQIWQGPFSFHLFCR